MDTDAGVPTIKTEPGVEEEQPHVDYDIDCHDIREENHQITGKDRFMTFPVNGL